MPTAPNLLFTNAGMNRSVVDQQDVGHVMPGLSFQASGAPPCPETARCAV
jgi:hypothetical protein